MARILVTGGAGFIFSHVAEYLTRFHSVTVIDNLSDGSSPSLFQKWKETGVIHTCLSDVNDIPADLGEFDYIIHAAAESNVDKSNIAESHSRFVHSNVSGTLKMLQFATKQRGLKSFLYVNTDEVYGSTEDWATSNWPMLPTNVYSASKAAGSHYVWAFANTYKLPVQEIRMCNIIGKRQATTKILPRLIECCQQGTPFPLYDNPSNSREYMDVRDACALINEVLIDGRNEVYNLSFNQELTIGEMISCVERRLESMIVTVPSSRPGHDQRYRIAPHAIARKYMDGSKRLHYTVSDTIDWMLS